jgi:hypothetical protein
MRSIVFTFVLTAALVTSIGQALRYEPKEPDVVPALPPCDVVSYWQFVQFSRAQAATSRTQSNAGTRVRYGDQWLTADDAPLTLLEPAGINRYRVNDQRHNDSSSSITKALPDAWLWIALPDEWFERCERLPPVVKRY